MKNGSRRSVAILLAFLLTAGLLGGAVWADGARGHGLPATGDGADFQAAGRRLLIGYEPILGVRELTGLVAEQGFVVDKVWPELGLAALSLAPGETERSLTEDLVAMGRSRLEHLPVAFVEADGVVSVAQDDPGRLLPDAPPNDPLLSRQWYLDTIAAPGAWAVSQGSAAVVVALIDTGYDWYHEDISYRSLWSNPAEMVGMAGIDDDGNGYVDDRHGWDWIQWDGATNDPHGHGTHVGGVLAASTDNQTGIASVGRQITILPLRILDSRGFGSTSDLIDALEYARAQQVSIINLSLTLPYYSQALDRAVQAAYAQGILMVAAAGNLFGEEAQTFYPAAWPQVLAVAAVDAAGERAPFSNFGDSVDLAAPGAAVLSTDVADGYKERSGTSMATPQVAGLAALLWSLRPDLTHEALMDLLTATARDENRDLWPGWDPYLGHGIVDGAAALWQASAPLQFRRDDGSSGLLPVEAGAQVTLTVESPALSAAAGVGGHPGIVAGAVVRYATGPGLQAQDGAGLPYSSGVLLTDAAGRFSLTTAPVTRRGAYTLTVQVGQAAADMTFFAVQLPLTVTGQLVGPSPSPDMTEALFQAQIADASGRPILQDITVEVSTNVGVLGNGRQTMVLAAPEGQVLLPITGLGTVDLLNAGEIQIGLTLRDVGLAAEWRWPLPVNRIFFPSLPGRQSAAP